MIAKRKKTFTIKYCNGDRAFLNLKAALIKNLIFYFKSIAERNVDLYALINIWHVYIGSLKFFNDTLHSKAKPLLHSKVASRKL